MSKDWIQGVDKEMKREGTVGAFTKQAKRAGMSVHDFAMKVTKHPKDFSEKTRRRANLALTFEKMADKKKMAHGGKVHKQGYDSQLDESLATRLAPERKYKQSMKDRRDESKAGNKRLGRRAYSSVRAMDKGDRMMKHGGKVHKQGYADEQDESLGMRTGAESTKKQSYKARRDDSYGKFGKRDEEDRDITMARGGKIKEGKKVKVADYYLDDEASPKEATKTAIILSEPSDDEELVMIEYTNGSIDYVPQDVIGYAKGGTLSAKAVKKGYIRRDRYDKLKKDLKDQGADCADDIKTMKKDIGKKVAKRIDQVEKQKEKECKATEKTDNKEKEQSFLLAGIAGILMGAFFGKR